MATGDVPDCLNRIRAVLPPWFPSPENSPVINAVATGAATVASNLYALAQYAKLQTRIKTATGGWLDLIAFDYLGPTFQRRASESDVSFQSRILTFLLIPRLTVAGITAMLIALTGRTPSIIEAGAGGGGYDLGELAFDTAGCWVGQNLVITAFRPPGQGVPLVDGYDGGAGGFDVGAIEWVDNTQVTGQITDAEITLRVRQWMAAGVSYVLSISS